MTDRDEHWQRVYATKPVDGVSWYTPHLDRSLAYIDAAQLRTDSAILDVGAGASTLVDDLLDRGFSHVTVVDLAPAALDAARARLGERAAQVQWRVGDILTLDLAPASVEFWHDRAVFHFLRSADARRAYVDQARRAVRPGGHVLVATFGPNGPERCSGLDVARYDADGLHAEFGSQFRKIGSATEQHATPWGSAQEFVYCFCRVG